MSLVSFHRFLIATAIVFCLGFGVRELRAYLLGTGGAAALALAAVFTALGLALGIYLIRLRSILKLEE